MRVDRIKEICRLCRERSVLHLGFVQHRLWRERLKQGRWLHSKLSLVADHLVGFDYLEEEVHAIKEEFNYECYVVDVEKIEENFLDKRFDIIVCGELIEHLSNPGKMLEGIKKFMHQRSVLIVTTPNPYSQQRIRLIQKDKLEKNWLNKEHTMWFTYETLKQLLRKHGFQEVEYKYYDIIPNRMGTVKKGIVKLITGKLFENMHLRKKFTYNHDGLFFTSKLAE